MKEIIRFTASWCQPCKSLAKNLEGVDLGVPITVVDIDVNPEVAIEYQVRGVPTLILKSGDTQRRLVGVHTTEKIKEWIEQEQIKE
jgi:thioredoxin 1